MSFFSDIATKTKEFSQKSKDMSEINSLNNMIKQEECNIEQQFNAIGRHYLEKYGDNPEPDFAQFIQNMNNSKNHIDELQKQISSISSRYNCPNCGEAFKPDAVFCAKCGYKLPPRETPVPDNCQKCLSCGAIVKKDATFCTVCGNKMPDETSNQADTENKTEKVCHNCGYINSAYSLFCNECGCSLEESVIEAKEKTTSEASDNQVTKPLVEDIKTEYLETQEEIKATKACPLCGNIVDNAVIFCNNCGKNLAEISDENKSEISSTENQPEPIESPEAAEKNELSDKAAQKICPECSNILIEDAVYCNCCGHNFANDTPPEQVEYADNEKKNQPEQTPEATVECPNCHNILPIDAVFCNNCGCRFEPAAVDINKSEKSCPDCGNTLAANADYCDKCGWCQNVESIIDKTTDLSKQCPKCGTYLEHDALFCNECGHKLGCSENPTEQVQISTKTCYACGAQLESDALFCNICGTKTQ